MNMPEEFRPRPADTCLVFEIDGKGSLPDLKRGIRQFLMLHHPVGTAVLMAASLNLNFWYSRDRSERIILVTSDSSTLAECVLLDLYARILHHASAIETELARYTVSIQGGADAHKVSILSMHYFWMSSAFKEQHGGDGERYRLN